MSLTVEQLTELLDQGNHSLAIAVGNRAVTFDGRGVSDLHHLLLNDPGLLENATVADKVVGKGAAALMIAGGVARVHAKVISSPALALFAGSGVTVTYDTEVPGIINRRKTGPCPVEALCAKCTDAQSCLPLITEFINSLKH